MSFAYEIRGLREFEAAILRNPAYVISRANTFITRGLAEYRRIIWRNPWRLGTSGGGAPKDTGNLRDTHQQTVSHLEGRIYPTAPYAAFVHGIEGYPRRRSYQLRPWLDYAREHGDPAIQQHESEMLRDIVANLAS